MTISIADITTQLSYRFTTETLDETRLAALIDRAVRFYSRFNPVVKRSTVETKLNQQDYDLPTDYIGMRNVEHWKSGIYPYTAGFDAAAPLTVGGPVPHPSTQAELVIEHIRRVAVADELRGQWEVVGRKLRLWPTPTAGISVPIEYYALHVLNESEEYDTIPSEDLDMLADLTLAEVLESRWVEVSIEPDYALGLQRITKSRIPSNVGAVITSLRRKAANKYGGSVVT